MYALELSSSKEELIMSSEDIISTSIDKYVIVGYIFVPGKDTKVTAAI